MTTGRRVWVSLVLAPLREQKGRAALAILAIALGVALGYGVQLINAAASGEFEQALRILSGDADLTIHGPRSGFPEELYPAIARRPEVAVASPVIELDARVAGRPEALKLLGIDVFRAVRIQPGLAAAEGDSLDFLRPDRIFLSRSALTRLGVKPGEELVLQSGLAHARFTVAGVLASGAVREPLGVIDIAAAQKAFGRIGTVTRIEVRVRPGVDAQALARAWRELLPAGVSVDTPRALVERNASLTRAYRVNLDVLALVAIFTGSVLVFSSQALAAVRRRSQFALLRALGLSRSGVVGLVLLEALAIGTAGSAAGLALGHALAAAVLRIFGADLGAGYFRGVEATLAPDTGGLALFGALGIFAALAGSFAAAREVANAEPAHALRAGDEQNVFARLRAFGPGAAVFALGALLTFAPSVGGLPIGGYFAIALLLVGALMLMPRAALVVFSLAPMRGPLAARLGLAQLRGAPGPAGVSLAAVLASVALTASMAIMVYSFRQSLEAWLVRVLPAQLYLRLPPGSAATLISAELEAELAHLPGVERVQFTRTEQVLIAPGRPGITLLARDIVPSEAGRLLPMIGLERLPAPGGSPPVWISESLSELYGLAIGQTLEIPIAGRSARFVVAGVWRDYIRQQGAAVIERSEFERLAGNRAASEAAFWLVPGADTGHLAERIRATLPAGVQADLVQPGEIRETSLRIFDRTFGVTYALEAAAVAIGLIALSASFSALALARRREFGMLRHLGMTRRQIGEMLAWEGTLVSALGVGAGLVLGWIISLVLIHVVNRQSFHWSMDLAIPWEGLAGFAVAMIALASITAWAGARGATGDEAVHAVSEAW